MDKCTEQGLDVRLEDKVDALYPPYMVYIFRFAGASGLVSAGSSSWRVRRFRRRGGRVARESREFRRNAKSSFACKDGDLSQTCYSTSPSRATLHRARTPEELPEEARAKVNAGRRRLFFARGCGGGEFSVGCRRQFYRGGRLTRRIYSAFLAAAVTNGAERFLRP